MIANLSIFRLRRLSVTDETPNDTFENVWLFQISLYKKLHSHT